MKKDHVWFLSGVSLFTASMVFFVLVISIVFLPRFIEALRPKPEKFTELFFEDHLKIPKTLLSGQEATVSATIHNLEHETKTYPIEIFAQDDSDVPIQIPLLSTEVTLDHDEAETISIPVSLTVDQSKRMKVVVLLQNLEQTIHFWVTVSPSASSSAVPITVPTEATASAPPFSTSSGILRVL
jgi:uncharacterized membrane protein